MTRIVEMAGILGRPSTQPLIPVKVQMRLDALGLDMVKSSAAAPEQYELFYEARSAGYMRVRWHTFTVDFPTVDGVRLYEGSVDGFAAFSDAEREANLLMAINLIAAKLERDV